MKKTLWLGKLLLCFFFPLLIAEKGFAQKIFEVPGTAGANNCFVLDKNNNIYFLDDHSRIQRKDAVTGLVTRICGALGANNGHSGANGTPAIQAKTGFIQCMALDETRNYLYFSEWTNNYIRRVDLMTGLIYDVCGTSYNGNAGDNGPAIYADAGAATAICVDASGNIYFGNITCIRKIDINTGIVTLFAGTPGIQGYDYGPGNNGVATQCQIGIVLCLRADALGNIYLSEGSTGVIRKVNTAGKISAVAGGGSNTIYDGAQSNLVRISSSTFTFDSHGNLYFENSYRVWKMSASGIISLVAGTGQYTPISTLCADPKAVNLNSMWINLDSNDDLYLIEGMHMDICKASYGFEIKDVDINTLCAPGFSTPAVTPAFSTQVSGGIPPYTYSWVSAAGNTATLNSTTAERPKIMSISGTVAAYDLMVADNSGCLSSASRPVKVTLNTNQTFDLAMRDSYYDMMDESNSQEVVDPNKWDVWSSPDVWNRLNNDDLLSHQDPCSGSPCTNFMYTTIRNVGCKPSPTTASMELYWTVGGGPETWPGDWTTNLFGTTSLPQGTHVASVPITTAINPGEKFQLNNIWVPPNPHDYYTSTTADMTLCFLARILDNHQPSNTDGMTTEEGTDVSTNVRNNNNIVTRNTRVVFVSNYKPRVSYLKVGNANNMPRTFTLQFLNPKPAQSTLHNYVKITVNLGPVFAKWYNAGASGTYLSMDSEHQSVTFDGTTTMQLNNIPFSPFEQYDIQITFEVKNGVNGTSMKDEMVQLRQLYNDDHQTTQVYSSYSYLLTYNDQEDDSKEKPADPIGINNVATYTESGIKIYPNPASEVLNIEFPEITMNGMVKLLDINGRILGKQSVNGKQAINFDVKCYPAGIYLYEINANGKLQTGKIIIKK